MPDLLQQAKERLDGLRLRQRALTRMTISTRIASAIMILFLMSILLEANFHFGTLVRGIILVLSIVASMTGSVLVFWLIKRVPTLQEGAVAEEYWALKLGETASKPLRDRLLNAIQVNRERPDARDPHSMDLAQAALYAAVSNLPEVESDDVIEHEQRKQALRILAVVSAVFIGSVIISPTVIGGAVGRILSPGREYVQPVAFKLSVSHSTGWAYKGEPVNFEIIAEGDIPRSVDFVYANRGGNPVEQRVKMDSGVVKLELPQLTVPVTYYVQSGDVKSPEQRLEIITRPQVTEMQYRLIAPRYSRLSIVTASENVGDVETLPGSKLEVSIRVNKPLSKAEMVFLRNGADSSHADTTIFEIEGSRATASKRLYREGSYFVTIADKEGHRNKDPIKYKINLMSDEYPTVFIEYPDVDLDLGEAMAVPLKVVAEDDFGISRMVLRHRVLGPDSTVLEFPLPTESQGTESVTSEMFWDVSSLAVFPGDVIEYWAVCWDNDNVSGPKSAESERRLLRFPTFEEILAGVETTEEDAMAEAESALESAKELREEVSEIIEEMRRNPEVDWERQQQLESAIQKQTDLEKQVEEIGKKIDELVQRLEENDLIAEETLQKYQELQELMAEVATPEMREAMEKLQKAMQEQDPEKIREAMEQFDMDREQFLERIERSLSIFKQLQLERKLDELAKMTEELLHQQEEILDQMESKSMQDLANREDALAKSTEMLNKTIEATKALAEELGQNDLANTLDSLALVAENKQIPQTMSKMSGQMRSGQKKSAQQSGEQAARDLAEMAGAFQQTASDFKEAQKNEMAKQLRRLTEDLLYVSRDQEDLSIESITLGTHSPRYRQLSSQQDDIMRNVVSITNRLYELSKETFFITPQLGAELGSAAAEIDKAIFGYSDRNPRSVRRPQSNAMGSLNMAVLQLLDILSQLEGSSSSSGYEEMMERLQQMAQQQQGLNQESMMMPGGEQQMQMPGGQGQSGFQRMAAQQRALEEKMRQMSEEAGEGMQEILGDLDNISKDMGEVAGDFEDQNIQERTRRLQRQIVSRLLDATRSVREQEYSKQRESKSARKLSRRSPDELQLDKDKDQLQRDLLKALQQGYTRDYRRLIREYFNSLQEVEVGSEAESE